MQEIQMLRFEDEDDWPGRMVVEVSEQLEKSRAGQTKQLHVQVKPHLLFWFFGTNSP